MIEGNANTVETIHQHNQARELLTGALNKAAEGEVPTPGEVDQLLFRLFDMVMAQARYEMRLLLKRQLLGQIDLRDWDAQAASNS